MLCCTSVLLSVNRSATKGLRELFYAVLHICAVICTQIYGPGLRRAALCCAVDLCCHLCSDQWLGLKKAALCCAVHLCYHLCSVLWPRP